MAKKRRKPLGKEIQWSKLQAQDSDDIFLEMATQTPEIIELAKAQTVPALKPFLEAELREDGKT